MDQYHLCKAWPIVSIDTIGIDPSIIQLKLSHPFSVLAVFCTFYQSFLVEAGHFFVAMKENNKNLVNF